MTGKQTNRQFVEFAGGQIEVTAPTSPDATFDVSPMLREPADFHGDPNVHSLILFGQTFSKLIGEHKHAFPNKNSLPDQGIIILGDHYAEARKLVALIDEQAKKVIADAELYDDVVFCKNYFELAKAGYDLLRKKLPNFSQGSQAGIPVSLERAGLVTTRLAHNWDPEAKPAEEIRVVTKRAHPNNGNHTDLMVTVRWRHLLQANNIDDTVIDIADFVNPASWASTAAFLIDALTRNAVPTTVIHRSIMATEQGIAFAQAALKAMGNIKGYFYTLGTTNKLTTDYYLHEPSVADAGHILRHFLPSWYKQ